MITVAENNTVFALLHLCACDQFPPPSYVTVHVFTFDSGGECSEQQMFLRAFRILLFNLLQGSSCSWLQSLGGCVGNGMQAPQKAFEELVKEKDFTQEHSKS